MHIPTKATHSIVLITPAMRTEGAKRAVPKPKKPKPKKPKPKKRKK